MKKKILLIIFMICGLLFSVNVFAEEAETTEEEFVTESLCSLEEKNKLRVAAANVTVNYQPVEVVEGTGIDDSGEVSGVTAYYFDIKIFNINSSLKVTIKSDKEEIDNEVVLTYKNIGKDGAITARKRVSDELYNLVFEISGADETGACSLQPLRTIKLTLPKYNHLAEREVCNEVPEFYMCQKYISYNIKPENFSSEIKKYKEKIKKEKEDSEAEVEDNNSLPSKAADLIDKNKFVIVGAIVLAGVIITVIIIRRKKRVL